MARSTRTLELLSQWGESRPLPGLAASSATPFPKSLLVWLAALMGLSGLWLHSPWQGPDIEAIAMVRSHLEARQFLAAGWLSVPSLGQWVMAEQGPLFIWLAAGMAVLLGLGAELFGAGHWLTAPLQVTTAARLTQLSLVLLGLWALWRATYRLARRREARPFDPLGIGPAGPDFARTVADCAVLFAVGTLGAIARWHEAGSATGSFALQALLLWALSMAPERPRQAGLGIGLSLTGLLLSDGMAGLSAAGLGVVLVGAALPGWRMTVKEWGSWAGLVLAVGIASWVLLAAMLQESAALSQWWQAQWFLDEPSLTHGPNTWAWTWWPAWPVIAALLVQAWRHRLLGLAHLQLLLVLLGTSMVMGLLGVGNVNPTQALPVVTLACLAAFGLLSLPRGLSSLIDWFAVTVFSGLGILIWLYWSAIEFNQPAYFAERLAFLAPGIRPQASLLSLLLGTVASGLWMALVLWRTRRTETRLWRPVLLTAGGYGLSWVLLMALLLPALEINRGYQPLAEELQAAMAAQTSASQAPDPSLPYGYTGLGDAQCIEAADNDLMGQTLALAMLEPRLRPLSGGLQASLSSGPQSPLGEPRENKGCRWLLVFEDNFRPEPGEWTRLWQGPRKPSRNNRERFTLYERQTPSP